MADIAGLEAYASVQQDGRNTWQSVAAQLGRQLSATPSHLSRALYVPRHDSSMSHLPLYDISTRYADAVGDLPIGSSKYAVKLGLMQRPRGDGGDDILVLCNAHISPVGDSDTVKGSVQYRGQPTEPCPEVGLSIGTSDDNVCCVTIPDPAGSGTSLQFAMTCSFPISPSVTREGTFTHPYFTFRLPGEAGGADFQWQIHPVEHGPLRYTLVQMPPEGQTTNDPEIQAIYHHIGLGASLSQSHSEGVLLLPSAMSPETCVIVVATALAMLSRLRGLNKDQKGHKMAKESKHSRLASIKNLVKGKRT
ncbi:predicted protein [Aspergillus terreus NIH2624]|uniref:Uncharacterized protein n=1 Tax=Aspergillus terreus (strain NIH 2624 / FGSC A1156) TaxID=341663 RepID=Q0CK47_ASPTN|nr:uncharacterized protein ATEG_05937 [Aspergillus terreus NIH2624]EAU33698.1 predicted protein [Aspergillus terreus NIH2624]